MEPGIVTIAIYIALVLFVPAVLVGIYSRLGALIEIARRLEARDRETPAPVPHAETAAPNWSAPTPLAGRIIMGIVLVGGAIAMLWLSVR
jgi:hypothetical protein